MAPKMQSQLIEAMCHIEPSTRHIFDPFVGSGTIMTEAMMEGLDFTGQDINPLAILICRVKCKMAPIVRLSLTLREKSGKIEETLVISPTDWISHTSQYVTHIIVDFCFSF